MGSSRPTPPCGWRRPARATRKPGSTGSRRRLPATGLLGGVRRAASAGEAMALLADPSFDPRTTAVLPARAGVAAAADAPGRRGAARCAKRAKRWWRRSSSPAGGVFATRRAFLPLYRAEIDGRHGRAGDAQRPPAGPRACRRAATRLRLYVDRRPTWAALCRLRGLALDRRCSPGPWPSARHLRSGCALHCDNLGGLLQVKEPRCRKVPPNDPQSTDIDPVETREWLEALADVLEHDGAERARFLLAASARKSAPRPGRAPARRDHPLPQHLREERPAALPRRPGGRRRG